MKYLNNFKIFFFKNYIKIFLILFTFILFTFSFLPFILFNSLDKFDTPGLLSLSWFIKEYRLPDFSGFNPFFYSGFPQGVLYSPLFHYLVAFIGKIITLEYAYKLIVTIFGLLIPYSLYKFLLSIYKKESYSLFGTGIILLILIFLPGYLGFNFDGLFDYGLAPSFCSIPLFFLTFAQIINKKSWKIISILLTILTLMHLLSAFILIIYIGFNFLINKEKQFKYYLKIGLIYFLLSSFFIIPFLYFYKYTQSGFPSKISFIYSLIPFVLNIPALIMIKKWNLDRTNLSIIIVNLLISTFSIFEQLINYSSTKFTIPLLHPFRIQIYPIIMSIVIIPFYVQKIHPFNIKIAKKFNILKFFKFNPHVSMNLFFLLILLIGIIFFRLDTKGPEEVNVANMYHSDKQYPETDGRAMRVYKVSEVLDQSRAIIDHSVMDQNQFSTMGLLKESSYLSIYYQSLAKSINPENFDFTKLDQYYLENNIISKEKTDFLMNLTWTKYLFTIESIPDCFGYTLLDEFKSNSTSGIKDIKMYLCQYNPSFKSNFIETIPSDIEIIDSSWNTALKNWWFNDETKLFTDKEIKFSDNSNFSNENINYEFSDDYQSIKIINSSDSPKSIFVKLSYFPNWKAFDKEGKEIEIYRISPNFMGFNIDEEINLKYSRSIIEKITLIISSLTLSAIIIQLIILFFKNKKWKVSPQH